MEQPVFRNPDLFQVLPIRDWIRDNLPPGHQGFVAEDLDLVVRCFGAKFGTDGIGKFMLVELKYGNNGLGVAQEKTFGLIHGLLRIADPNRDRYLGYHLLQYGPGTWPGCSLWLNRRSITWDEFQAFLMFETDEEGLWEQAS